MQFRSANQLARIPRKRFAHLNLTLHLIAVLHPPNAPCGLNSGETDPASTSRPLDLLLAALFSAPVLLTFGLFAQVVELVDTQVSEACALTAWGFESPLGHHFCKLLSYNILS